MNARTHYISLLKSAEISRFSAPDLQDGIRNGLIEWLLCRDYLETDDCLERLASDMRASEEDVSAFIYLGTGNRLRSIRKELRIYDAQILLLRYPDTPVNKICKYVGIEDKSNFRKLFRDVVGCTPTDWRKYKGSVCQGRIILHRCLSKRG